MANDEPTFTQWRAVCDARHRFATAVDGRDWGLLRSVLADPILLDYSSYSGEPAVTLDPSEWVDRCRGLFEGLDATQHSLSNPQVRMNGKIMRCTMYVVAEHLLDDDRYTLGGYYTDVLVPGGDGWLLRDMTLTVLWRRGDPAVLTRARGA